MNTFTSRLCQNAFPSFTLALQRPCSSKHPLRKFLSCTDRTMAFKSVLQTNRRLSRHSGSHSVDKVPEEDSIRKDTISLDDLPGSQTEGEKYVILYTCKVCDHRSGQKISKQGYHHGTVLVRCSSCSNLHLIADHLGE